MFKNFLFDMFLNPSFKMTTSFANVLRTTARTSKDITRKDFKSSGIGFLYQKQFLTSNELKTSLMLKFSLQNPSQSFESLFLIWCEKLLIYGNVRCVF